MEVLSEILKIAWGEFARMWWFTVLGIAVAAMLLVASAIEPEGGLYAFIATVPLSGWGAIAPGNDPTFASAAVVGGLAG